MLELLGLLGGALARFAPTLLDYFKQGRDLKYEVIRLEKEVELEKLRGANAREEIAASTAAGVDLAWANSLVEAVKTAVPPPLTDTGKWYLNVLNAMNVSVRPVLTYWWCIGMYSGAKLAIVWAEMTSSLPSAATFAQVLLTDFDRAVVGSIIGFWFLDRALRGK